MSQNYERCTKYELKVKDVSVFCWNVCNNWRIRYPQPCMCTLLAIEPKIVESFPKRNNPDKKY